MTILEEKYFSLSEKRKLEVLQLTKENLKLLEDLHLRDSTISELKFQVDKLKHQVNELLKGSKDMERKVFEEKYRDKQRSLEEKISELRKLIDKLFNHIHAGGPLPKAPENPEE